MGIHKAAGASLILPAMLMAGCISLQIGSPKRGEIMILETLVEAEGYWTSDKVLLVGISGLLSARPDTGGFFSRPGAVVRLKDVLKRAEEDDSIKALLLRIDSPGGSVVASDLLYHELKRFKEKTGKKIAVICMGVAASGGYYAAMAADAVYLHPTTITGSIGVIGIFPNLEGLSSMIGLDMRVVKSGDHKDMGSMWRSFTADERAILQETIDHMYERFLEVIAEGRPKLDPETIRRLADGRTYYASQAVELGLADAVGYMEDAFEAAKVLAGIDDASLVVYKRPLDYKGHYYASSDEGAAPRLSGPGAPATQVNLLNLDFGANRFLPEDGPFYYLWVP